MDNQERPSLVAWRARRIIQPGSPSVRSDAPNSREQPSSNPSSIGVVAGCAPLVEGGPDWLVHLEEHRVVVCRRRGYALLTSSRI
jgi:hypothetical protein